MRLVYTATGEEVKVGDVVTTERGTPMKVISFSKPHKPSSSGKVFVEVVNDNWKQEYYVSVIGAEWIEREDRQ